MITDMSLTDSWHITITLWYICLDVIKELVFVLSSPLVGTVISFLYYNIIEAGKRFDSGGLFPLIH